MTGSVNDGDHVARSLELPESDIDSDTTLTLGLQFVQDPRILEGTLAQLSSFLLMIVSKCFFIGASRDWLPLPHQNFLNGGDDESAMKRVWLTFSNFSMVRLSIPPHL